MPHIGMGRIRIFDEQIRRGISVIEDYVYKAIEKGFEPVIINALITRRGKETLAPTIMTYKQVRVLVDEAYETVKNGYSFFKDVENEADFKRWVYLEIENRISRQTSFIGEPSQKDLREVKIFMHNRAEAFNDYKHRSQKNAAQQRHEDLQHIRLISKRCWDKKISLSRLAAEFRLSEDKVTRLRKTVMYLREVRALIVLSRPPKDIIKWVKSYTGKEHVFAERMGLREDVAETLLQDVFNEFAADRSQPTSTLCERRGMKNLTGKYGKDEKAPVCDLCGAEYEISNRTGFYTHP